MKPRLALSCVGLSMLLVSFAAGQTTQPAAGGPELTPRQQDLLLQLSDAEANIQAINKQLKVTGYSVGVAYSQIDSSLKGNELMNRQGGGPVRWDEFYGKTAKDYPRTGFWDDRMDDHRPKQFNFVYKANNDQIARAKAEIASLASNQQALLDRRHVHEEDQSRLWATLAWEDVEDREIEFRPLYRFALKPAGPDANVLAPVILFLRSAASVAHDGLDSIQSDQSGTFQSGSRRMGAAYAALRQSLADALYGSTLKPDRLKEGQALKAMCKELAEQTKVIADDYANALDRDKAREDNSKLEFRGQLQSSLSTFATQLGMLDDEVSQTAASWALTPDKDKPAADAGPPQATSATGAPPASPGTGAETGVPPANGGESVDVLKSAKLRKDPGVVETADGLVCSGDDDTAWLHLDGVAVPFAADFVAKTDSTNIRIRYGNGGAAFNWERNPNDLRFVGPRGGKVFVLSGRGSVPVGKWNNIKFVVNENYTAVFVDGELRGRIDGDFKGLTSDLSIGNSHGSVVTVKSFRLGSGIGDNPAAAPPPQANTPAEPATAAQSPVFQVDPAPPVTGAVVKVKYASGDAEFDTLSNGVKFFKDQKKILVDLPDELAGLTFARRITRSTGAVEIDCPAGSTVYALVDMGADAQMARPDHVNFDQGMTNSGWVRLKDSAMFPDKFHHFFIYKATFSQPQHLVIPDIKYDHTSIHSGAVTIASANLR